MKSRLAHVAVVLALVASGCDSGGPIDDVLTAPLFVPPKGDLQDQSIVVPMGRALAFVAQPMSAEETLKRRIRLESTDTSIAGVEKTVEMNQFVVFGAKVGTTELEVHDDDGRVAPPRFKVEVIEP